MPASIATIWNSQGYVIPIVNAAGQLFEEWQIAAQNQTVFTLTTFQYTPGTKTIQVYVNGVLQQRVFSYSETSSTAITFTSQLNLNDTVCFISTAILGVLTP